MCVCLVGSASYVIDAIFLGCSYLNKLSISPLNGSVTTLSRPSGDQYQSL